GALYEMLGVWNLMLLAAGLLVATVPLVEQTWRAVPAMSRNGQAAAAAPPPARVLGGFALVLRDRYLLLLAVLAVLLNCVSSTGEYILTELVMHDAARQVAADPALDKDALIAAFYADYNFATN